MSSWIYREDVAEVNFYLAFIQGFQSKLMHLTFEADCSQNYREDLVYLLHNTYFNSDTTGRRLILNIENLSEFLLHVLAEKLVREDIKLNSLTLIGEITNFNDEKCSDLCQKS